MSLAAKIEQAWRAAADAVDQQIATLETDLASAQQALTGATQALAERTAERDAALADIEQLHEELVEAQQRVATLTTDLAAAVARGDSLDGQLSAAQAACTAHTATLTQQAATIAAHTATITDLQGTITALQARVAELEALVPEPEVPFVLGETEPTADNTGCRIPVADLVHYPHTVTSTHPVTGQPLQRGDVISGVRVPALAITVPGVTVRDVLVDGVGLSYTPTGQSNDYRRLVDCRPSPGGSTDDDLVVYEHVTVDPATRSYMNVAFQGANFRAYRCLVRGVTDAFSPHSTGGQTPRAVEILGCRAEDFYIATEPATNQSDLITHNDFVQSAGKLRRLRIEGCSVAGGSSTTVGTHARPRTSNILLQTGQGTYTDDGVTIRRNWLRGHPTQGSTINIPVTMSCPVVIEDNVIAADGKHPRVLISSAVRTASTSTIAGNVLDTGGAAPINNA